MLHTPKWSVIQYRLASAGLLGLREQPVQGAVGNHSGFIE
jgi:hypothetical protein